MIGTSLSPRVYISYRRSDSSLIVGRIREQLDGWFGRGAVFRDVDSIQLGEQVK